MLQLKQRRQVQRQPREINDDGQRDDHNKNEGKDCFRYIEKMTTAQGIVLGSPSYFQDVTAEMKALIDRAGFVGLANGRMHKNKVGAAVSCLRRSGGLHTIETMNHFFLSNELIIAGRAMSVARDKGEVEKDQEGIQTAQTLGQRTAWVMKKLYG